MAEGEQKPRRKGKPKGAKDLVPRKKRANLEGTAKAAKALEQLPPGENTKYVNHLMKITALGQGTNKKDVNMLANKFSEYLKICSEDDVKIGNMSAYLAMGITREEAYQWEHRISGTEEHKKLIQLVKAICASYREAAMNDGKLNAIVGIFWQKCYDGLNEETEVLSPTALASAAREDLDAETIKEKYSELPE